MMPSYCNDCKLSFTRPWNYTRHLQIKHGEMKEDDFEPEENESQDESMSEDEESTTDSMEEEVDTTEDKEEPKAQGNDHWRTAIDLTIEKMNDDGYEFFEDPIKMLREPYLGEFVHELQQVVESRIKFANYFENDDPVYVSISRIKEKAEEEDALEEDECADIAWSQRRFAVRKIIRENIDLFDDEEEDDADGNEIPEETEEDEDDDDEEDEEDEDEDEDCKKNDAIVLNYP